MQVPFGEWLPDQPDHGKQGANVATNVYYAANTYKRFPSLVAYSSNTTSTKLVSYVFYSFRKMRTKRQTRFIWWSTCSSKNRCSNRLIIL